jgi:hypothetical protein
MNVKKTVIAGMLFFFVGSLLGMARESIIVTRAKEQGRSITLHIEAGKHWEHQFEAGSISITTTPQIAVWIEDLEGNYVDTLYVTRRTATQKWRGKAGPYEEKGNIRRKAALPYWAHSRGIQYDDGLYLPTKKNPLPDTVTSASPKSSFQLSSSVSEDLDSFVLLVELNNSTDFNDFYTREAVPGNPYFSGGSFGSGQPALVYQTVVHTYEGSNSYELKLAGHSSPYGEDGQLYRDVSKISTAKQIAERIIVMLK